LATLVLLVLFAACSLDLQTEYVSVTVTNSRAETILIQGGQTVLDIEVLAGTQKTLSVAKGKQIVAKTKASGTYLAARSFYLADQRWDLN